MIGMKRIVKLPYRRRLEGRTNYKKRIALLKSGKLRLVIRRTNKYLILQVVKFEPQGDKVLYSVNSKELLKFGWNISFKNIPAAYLSGLLLGKKIKGKVDSLILDIGVQEKSDKLFAALKGVVNSGIDIPYDESVFPSEDRINGKHIDAYLTLEHNPNQFSKYNNIKVEELFNKVKEKIESQ